MGYYTDYTVKIERYNGTISENAIDDRLEEISNYDIRLNEVYNAKWYDHEEHMKKLSLEFPNVLFQVDGSGEESGDIWRAYVCNGTYEYAKAELSFPSLDAGKVFENAAQNSLVTDEEYRNALTAIERANKLVERYRDQ